MLSNVSWSNYVITVVVLVVLWYGFVIYRYYSGYLKGILSGKNEDDFSQTNSRKKETGFFFNNPQNSERMENADELSVLLVKAIEESKDVNLSKEELKNYLQLILSNYPDVKMSSQREKINKLMVSECEKHPQMIITYAEVDGLWDEAI